MSFEDRILLSLKRKYSKDEEIGLLVDKIKKIEISNGKLKSEVSELKHKLSSQSKKIHNEKMKMGAGKQKTIDELRRKLVLANNGITKDETVKSYQRKSIKLKEERDEYQNKYLSLLAKIEKENK